MRAFEILCAADILNSPLLSMADRKAGLGLVRVSHAS